MLHQLNHVYKYLVEEVTLTIHMFKPLPNGLRLCGGVSKLKRNHAPSVNDYTFKYFFAEKS